MAGSIKCKEAVEIVYTKASGHAQVVDKLGAKSNTFFNSRLGTLIFFFGACLMISQR